MGDRRCPSCLRRFAKLRPSAGAARRDCACGGRWVLRFEPASGHLARAIGQEAVRVVVEPYVDRRRRRPESPGQLAFALDAPGPPARATRTVRRGTTFRTRRA